MELGLQGNPKQAADKATNVGCWVQASPGNLQQLEDVLFGGGAITHTPLTLAVRLGRQGAHQGGRLVGVAYADPTNHVLGVAEFTDSDQLSELQV